MTPRSPQARVADALHRLETEDDAWIATASPDGVPHLIPLSLAWEDGQVMMITPTDTLTVRNVTATGQARVSLADTDDVVVLRGSVTVVPLEDVDAEVVDRFVARVGWTPSTARGPWSVLFIAPRIVHAWRDVDEFEGRTIMRDGVWVS